MPNSLQSRRTYARSAEFSRYISSTPTIFHLVAFQHCFMFFAYRSAPTYDAYMREEEEQRELFLFMCGACLYIMFTYVSIYQFLLSVCLRRALFQMPLIFPSLLLMAMLFTLYREYVQQRHAR